MIAYRVSGAYLCFISSILVMSSGVVALLFSNTRSCYVVLALALFWSGNIHSAGSEEPHNAAVKQCDDAGIKRLSTEFYDCFALSICNDDRFPPKRELGTDLCVSGVRSGTVSTVPERRLSSQEVRQAATEKRAYAACDALGIPRTDKDNYRSCFMNFMRNGVATTEDLGNMWQWDSRRAPPRTRYDEEMKNAGKHPRHMVAVESCDKEGHARTSEAYVACYERVLESNPGAVGEKASGEENGLSAILICAALSGAARTGCITGVARTAAGGSLPDHSTNFSDEELKRFKSNLEFYCLKSGGVLVGQSCLRHQ